MAHPTIRELMEKLEESYPRQLRLNQSNSGLQIGRLDGNADCVMIALDATDEVMERCISDKANFLITYHPLKISGIKKISDDDVIGRRILTMAERGISHYAIDTDYDAAAMNDLAEDRLSLWNRKIFESMESMADMDEKPYGVGYSGRFIKPILAGELCDFVKREYSLNTVRLFGSPGREIQSVIILPKSGKETIRCAVNLGADLLITDHISHQDGLEAVEQDLMVMDAGNLVIEYIFEKQMKEWLRERFPLVRVLPFFRILMDGEDEPDLEETSGVEEKESGRPEISANQEKESVTAETSGKEQASEEGRILKESSEREEKEPVAVSEKESSVSKRFAEMAGKLTDKDWKVLQVFIDISSGKVRTLEEAGMEIGILRENIHRVESEACRILNIRKIHGIMREFIQYRLGLDNQEIHTLEETAEYFGISMERAVRLEKEIQRRLIRHGRDPERLKKFLEG